MEVKSCAPLKAYFSPVNRNPVLFPRNCRASRRNFSLDALSLPTDNSGVPRRSQVGVPTSFAGSSLFSVSLQGAPHHPDSLPAPSPLYPAPCQERLLAQGAGSTR